MKKTLLYVLSLTVAGALAGCSQADNDNSAESAASSSAGEETAASTATESSSPDAGTTNPSGAAEAAGGDEPAGEGSEEDTAFDEEAARKQLLESIDSMTSYTMTYQQGDNSSGADSWLEEYTFNQELTAEFDGERLASWETDRRDPIPGTGEVVLKDSMRFIAKNAKLSTTGSSPELIEGAVPSGIPIPLDADLVTCAQDGDFVTDSARLVFDPEKGLLHHVDYVISTMDFTAEGTAPGTPEDHLKCHVVWDFHEINGSAVEK